MGAVLAARMGDRVGSHSSGFWACIGLIGSVLLGAAIGFLMVAAVVATGGGFLLLAAAVAGGLCVAADAGSAGERLGEAYDLDEAKGSPCSTITNGCPTVYIENQPAARIGDPTDCGGAATIKQGSKYVVIGGRNAARHSDLVTCTGAILPQTKSTYIGGPSVDSRAPSKETFASVLHDLGTDLDEDAKVLDKVALALGAAAIAAPILIAGGTALLSGAGISATFGAMGVSAAAAVPGAASLVGEELATKAGEAGGEYLGKAIDHVAGYEDARFEHFSSTWGGIAGGFVGGKLVDGMFESVKVKTNVEAPTPHDMETNVDAPAHPHDEGESTCTTCEGAGEVPAATELVVSLHTPENALAGQRLPSPIDRVMTSFMISFVPP